MNNDASMLPAREIAITLMRSALALLDHVGAAEAAAGLQSAIDIAEEEQGSEPT